MAAHLKHGDALGECEEEEEGTLSVVATARVNIGSDCQGGAILKSTYGVNGAAMEEVSGGCSIFMPLSFR